MEVKSLAHGLHLFVDDGIVICVISVFPDGTRNRPWRPFTFTTLEHWTRNQQSDALKVSGNVFIHV